jgi:LacI family transcriptional regulator
VAAQRPRKVTIKDIAERCNVSTQTVSRVINQRPDVAPQTREAVERAIAELGYRPSALARSLVQQHSYTLGAIVAGLKYIGVAQTLNGITEQCEAAGYALLIKELPRFDASNILPIVDSLIAHQVEGIIFAAPELHDNVTLARASLPAICPPIIFLKSQPHPDFTTISIDNYGGARRAVEHLLALGRRRIGCISGPMEWLESRQRWQAWADVMARAGAPVAEEHWRRGNWSSASGAAACAQLVRSYPQMDAIFASNDQMALGALHYAYSQGVRVPEDLAVVGFDDLTESAYFTPALTTVHQPLRELGILAVKTLLAQIEGEEPPFEGNSYTLDAELIVRASAPAAGGRKPAPRQAEPAPVDQSV